MTMHDEQHDSADLTSIAAEIVSAYVSNNPVPVAELPKLIGDIYGALHQIGTEAAEPAIKQEPAVPVRKSVTPDFIICLEDGKKFKSLKRHLMTHYNISPDQYRQKWSLPADYPMVAPNYAATRSALAKASGLGRKAAPEKKSKPRSVAAASVSPVVKARKKKSPAK